MKPKKQTVRKFIDHYRRTSTEELSDGYVSQLHVAVSLLERFNSGPVRLKDLSDELVNEFVEWLTENGRAPDTVRGRRNSILTLWRAAFEQEILKTPPQRIRKVRSQRRLPEAWSREHVEVLQTTALQDHYVWRNGLTRGAWMAALIGAGWDTALRLGDLLRLRFDDVREGPMCINQHKTKDDVIVRFTPRTLQLIDKTMEDGRRELVWPLWAQRTTFYSTFKRLVERAGIPCGTFRYLRRGAITDVEVAGGNGSLLAGHRSRQVTERHYIDVSHLTRPTPRPLGG